MSDWEYTNTDEEFNLKALRLVSGKEIIADVQYNEKAGAYVLEFPLAVIVETNEFGKPQLGLTRYILSGDYDRTMFLTPNNIETIAGVSATMKEKYLNERAEYFNLADDSNVELDEMFDEYEEPTVH
jgi:hypothetical protein